MDQKRHYHLGKRQPAVDRTATRILRAARGLVAERPATELRVAEVARRAGVSRITVYNRFGSRHALLEALAPAQGPEPSPATEDPREALHRILAESCSRWAADPSLFRNLRVWSAGETELGRRLAERLAEADQLRPGCSIREAEDVIAALASFPVFDQLHRAGRRSSAAVAEILIRLAGAILVA